MDPLPNLRTGGKDGQPKKNTNLTPDELKLFVEPTSYMDRLYNCPNSYFGSEFGANSMKKPWFHKKPADFLKKLGADTYWPMPDIISLEEAKRQTQLWKDEVFSSFSELNFYYCRYGDVVCAALGTSNDRRESQPLGGDFSDLDDLFWSDHTLEGIVDEVMQDVSTDQLLGPVFGGNGQQLPPHTRAGLWIFNQIFTGFAEHGPKKVPVPVYKFPVDERLDKPPGRIEQHKATAAQWRISFQAPILSRELIGDRGPLVNLIRTRAIFPPTEFAKRDWDCMQLGRSSRLILPPYCDDCFMTFDTQGENAEHGRDPDNWRRKGYGKILHSPSEDITPIRSLLERGHVFGWGDGLLIMQTQALLLRFSLAVARKATTTDYTARSKMLPIHPFYGDLRGNEELVSYADWRKRYAASSVRSDGGDDLQAWYAYCQRPRGPKKLNRYWHDHHFMQTDITNHAAYSLSSWVVKETERQRKKWGERKKKKEGQEQEKQQEGEKKEEQVMGILDERCRRTTVWVRDLLTSPATFRRHCREILDYHYGWVSSSEDPSGTSDNLLPHMVRTDIDAKRALANDVIRRCLRSFLFEHEIFGLMRDLMHKLKAEFFDKRNGLKDANAVVGISETYAYRAAVMNLRWATEVLTAHVRGQSVFGSSESLRTRYKRPQHTDLPAPGSDPVESRATAELWALPRGLLREPLPPLLQQRSDAEPRSPYDVMRNTANTLDLVPPGSDYGVPGLDTILHALWGRSFVNGRQPRISTMLTAAGIMASLLQEIESAMPLGSARQMFHDEDQMRRYREEFATGRFIDKLDGFDFEHHFTSKKGSKILADIHLLLGIKYANDPRTEITTREAKDSLKLFREELEKWWRKSKCSPEYYGLIDWSLKVHENDTVEDVQEARKWRGFQFPEDELESDDKPITLTDFCGKIETIDPNLAAPDTISPEPTEREPTEREPWKIYITQNFGGDKTWDMDPTLGDIKPNLNMETDAGGTGIKAREKLKKADWETVDSAFGSKKARSRVTWHDWSYMLMHMGFEMDSGTGSSARKFTWTTDSKLPQPSKKAITFHKPHAEGSVAVQRHHVDTWARRMRDELGITLEVIEAAYNRDGGADEGQGGDAQAHFARVVGGGYKRLKRVRVEDDDEDPEAFRPVKRVR